MDQKLKTKFLDRVKNALGRVSDSDFDVKKEQFFTNPEPGYRDAMTDSIENAVNLINEFEGNAQNQGWNTYKVSDVSRAREVLNNILNQIECKSIVCTNEQAVNLMQLDGLLSGRGIDICKMKSDDQINLGPNEKEQYFRSVAKIADVGITGCDFAVAETGTVVVIPKTGVSRLVSLAPPVHVAIVFLGQVVRSLDELFAIRRYQIVSGSKNGYMNLISGPSRSGDIENIMIQGVHGPGDVHLILVEQGLPTE